MSIGKRLKAERERLGYSQPAFAEIAGTTKKSQIDYEKDSTQPKAGYLEAIAGVGADVAYIITGIPSTPDIPQSLPADEQLLLDTYRSLPVPARKEMLATLLTGGKPKKPKASKVSGHTIHGLVGSIQGENNTVGIAGGVHHNVYKDGKNDKK